ncbi:MAG TPA: glycosyl hydrolase family 28-related protein, partial [Caulobacteraceae bacterium]
MTLSSSDIMALNALSENTALADSDILPVYRSSPLQFAKASTVAAYVLRTVKAFGAIGDGVNDDTSAIQAAFNSGAPVYFPAGRYLISATLTMTSAANHGQVVRGAGSVATDGAGAAKTVLAPTSAVSVLFSIDGTPFAGFVQGFGFENFAVDMAGMTDVAGSVAFDQVQAFGGHYAGIGVINDGVNKRGFRFQAGAYTTALRDCDCANVEFAGVMDTNRATTISFSNCDLQNVIANWALNITFTGGAIQPKYNPANVIYLPPGVTPYDYPANTTGLYAWSGFSFGNVKGMSFFGVDLENGGCPANINGGVLPTTFNDGVHGVLNLINVVTVGANALNTIFDNCDFAGCYVFDLSDATGRLKVRGYHQYAHDIDTSGAPLANLRNTAVQNMPSGAYTAVDVGGQELELDTDYFSWDSVNRQVNILRRCVLLIAAQVQMAATVACQSRLQIVTTEGSYYGPWVQTTASLLLGPAIAGIARTFNAGDTIQLQVYQNSGG